MSDDLVREMKLWASSPRVPQKVQLLLLEAIGRLSTQRPEAVASSTEAKLLQLWCEYTGGHLGGSEFQDMVCDIISDEILPKRLRSKPQ